MTRAPIRPLIPMCTTRTDSIPHRSVTTQGDLFLHNKRHKTLVPHNTVVFQNCEVGIVLSSISTVFYEVNEVSISWLVNSSNMIHTLSTELTEIMRIGQDPL